MSETYREIIHLLNDKLLGFVNGLVDTSFYTLWLRKEEISYWANGSLIWPSMAHQGQPYVLMLWLLKGHVAILKVKEFILKFKEDETDAIIQKDFCFKWNQQEYKWYWLGKRNSS